MDGQKYFRLHYILTKLRDAVIKVVAAKCLNVVPVISYRHATCTFHSTYLLILIKDNDLSKTARDKCLQ